MPLGNFVPASTRYGKDVFPGQPEQGGLTSEMQGILQSISAGAPTFDPSSSRFSPIPPSMIMSPAQRAAQTAAGPGQIGGGMDATAGLPFAASIGLGTGQGQAGSVASPGVQPSPTSPTGPATSQVVANMLRPIMYAGNNVDRWAYPFNYFNYPSITGQGRNELGGSGGGDTSVSEGQGNYNADSRVPS